MLKDRIGGHIDFVVTEGGRPGPTSTFIELEDATGRSAEVGEWVERREGEWALRIPYAGLEQIIADLYASVINASISWLWDGGIDVSIGDDLNGFVPAIRLRLSLRQLSGCGRVRSSTTPTASLPASTRAALSSVRAARIRVVQ